MRATTLVYFRESRRRRKDRGITTNLTSISNDSETGAHWDRRIMGGFT